MKNNYPKNRRSPPPFTKTARENMSKALMGHSVSEETREKIRGSLIGKPQPWQHSIRKGEENNKWKGGITPFNQKIRTSRKHSEWSLKVRERDKVCQDCGSEDSLIAHHIKSFSEFPEERFDINNGRTLCRSCHRIYHAKNVWPI